MSVVFLTEAGLQYGIGSMKRCEAVAQALAAHKSSIFIIDATPDVTRTLNFKTFIQQKWQEDPNAVRAIMDEIDSSESIESIFVDSEQVKTEVLSVLSSFGIPLFFMDDSRDIEYPKGTIINTELVTAKEYKKKDFTKVYTGVQYSPLLKPFWSMETLPYLKRKGVLVTLGGSDVDKPLFNIVNELKNYAGEPITILSQTDLEDLSENMTLVNCPQSDENMCKLIKHSRVIICGGGTTLLEAARCGTPAIVIKITESQKNNIQAWTNIGFSKFAGDKSNTHLGKNVLNLLKNLDEHHVWLKASKIGKELMDGLGAKRIAKIMINKIKDHTKNIHLKMDHEFGTIYLKNFLNCSPEEHIKINESRNSDEVRQANTNTNRLSLGQHKVFLRNLKQSQNSGYWEVLYKNEPIGVISLSCIDYQAKIAVLGYYKFTDCTRAGAGKILIESAKNLAFGVLDLKHLYAECFDNNIKSIRSLESVGFKLADEQKQSINNEVKVIRLYSLEKD